MQQAIIQNKINEAKLVKFLNLIWSLELIEIMCQYFKEVVRNQLLIETMEKYIKNKILFPKI